MKLGDFFSTAPYARPVNTKPVLLNAFSKDLILPGGKRNPTEGGVVIATLRGGFVFVGGDTAGEARHAARDYIDSIRKKSDKDGGGTKNYDGLDVGHEMTYQMLFRVLHEWDDEKKRAGDDPLFPSIDLLRKHVVPKEAIRVLDLYDAYVDQEHPEVIDDATFRGAQGGGAGVDKK